jgi:LysM repeat protein
MYGPQVRAAAATLDLTNSRRGDTWASLAERLGMPIVALRLYNPFLSDSRLRTAERLIAYPRVAAPPLLMTGQDGQMQYRARLGDNYFNIAFAFEVDLDALRNENDLWRLQVLPAGMVLTIPQGRAASEPQPAVERAAAVRPVEPPAPKFGVHRVTRGENLTVIARRYGTTVRELRDLNNLRRTTIRIGQRLRVPLD